MSIWEADNIPTGSIKSRLYLQWKRYILFKKICSTQIRNDVKDKKMFERDSLHLLWLWFDFRNLLNYVVKIDINTFIKWQCQLTILQIFYSIMAVFLLDMKFFRSIQTCLAIQDRLIFIHCEIYYSASE